MFPLGFHRNAYGFGMTILDFESLIPLILNSSQRALSLYNSLNTVFDFLVFSLNIIYCKLVCVSQMEEVPYLEMD